MLYKINLQDQRTYSNTHWKRCRKQKNRRDHCSFRFIDHCVDLPTIYTYIYNRNAQIGFTSRGLIDVYAAIAPMVERNPIRRAIRESKRSLDVSFVESLRFPFDSMSCFRSDDSFFRFSPTAELLRHVYYRNFWTGAKIRGTILNR